MRTTTTSTVSIHEWVRKQYSVDHCLELEHHISTMLLVRVIHYERHLHADDFDPYVSGAGYTVEQDDPDRVPAWVLEAAQKQLNITTTTTRRNLCSGK